MVMRLDLLERMHRHAEDVAHAPLLGVGQHGPGDGRRTTKAIAEALQVSGRSVYRALNTT